MVTHEASSGKELSLNAAVESTDRSLTQLVDARVSLRAAGRSPVVGASPGMAVSCARRCGRGRVAMAAAFDAPVGASECARRHPLAHSVLLTEVANGSAQLWDDVHRFPNGINTKLATRGRIADTQ